MSIWLHWLHLILYHTHVHTRIHMYTYNLFTSVANVAIKVEPAWLTQSCVTRWLQKRRFGYTLTFFMSLFSCIKGMMKAPIIR